MFLRKGEEIVVETESKRRDDEVSGDEEVMEHGPDGLEGERTIEGDIPAVLPSPESGVPSVSVLGRDDDVVERVMLVHAARMNELAAVDFTGTCAWPRKWRGLRRRDRVE